MKNLLIRTLSGLVFGALIVVSLLFVPQLYPVLAIVALYFMLNEFFNITIGDSLMTERRLAILSAWLLFCLVYCMGEFGVPARFLFTAVIPVIAIMACAIFRKDHAAVLDKLPYLFTGLLYIGLPVALSPILLFRSGYFDGWLMMSFFILIWTSDIGAYILGTAFGQKPDSAKLAPTISPKKSWWGFWSGIIFCAAAGFVLYLLDFLQLPLVHCLVISIIISASGVCGDLFESLWKRRFGFKDSGNIIPGHGGMLDRFDSSLVAIPLATVYLAIFNLL